MPQISNNISLGNILTMAGMAVAIIMAWSSVNADVKSSRAQLEDHETRIRIIEAKVSDTLSRIDERLTNIERKLSAQGIGGQ
jgi:septation ring formation regulator EzrA